MYNTARADPPGGPEDAEGGRKGTDGVEREAPQGETGRDREKQDNQDRPGGLEGGFFHERTILYDNYRYSTTVLLLDWVSGRIAEWSKSDNDGKLRCALRPDRGERMRDPLPRQ